MARLWRAMQSSHFFKELVCNPMIHHSDYSPCNNNKKQDLHRILGKCHKYTLLMLQHRICMNLEYYKALLLELPR